jgi:hypothetical protein
MRHPHLPSPGLVRRSLLALGLTLLAPTDSRGQIPVHDGPPPTATISYGADALQWGALRMPDGPGPFPLAIVVHGGCWLDRLGEGSLTPVAAELPAHGIATWDIEYRRLGHEGGGWPGTFQDVGRAVDFARVLADDYPLDLDRVAIVGHSSGAQMAVWAAGRPGLPEDSEIRGEDPLRVQAAVGIDGPMDLAVWQSDGRDVQVCGAPVILSLMGGSPEEVPQRYAQGSPAEMPPLDATIYLNPAGMMIQPGKVDGMTGRMAETGETVVVRPVPESNHFQLITPGHETWPVVLETIREALRPDPGDVAERGAGVMPFDLERTTHRFEPLETGGRQTVVSDDGDPEQIALIREHLAHEAERFARGDFHDPAMIHGHDMAGLHTLMMGHERMTVTYSDVEAGGEIVYASGDQDIIQAIHMWFEQQVRDHGSHAEGHSRHR